MARCSVWRTVQSPQTCIFPSREYSPETDCLWPGILRPAASASTPLWNGWRFQERKAGSTRDRKRCCRNRTRTRSFSSELLQVRPQVQFMRPGIARLDVQHPVCIGNMVWVENAVLRFQCVAFREQFADERRVDGAVDDRVRYVDALGSEFARHALCQRAQRMFGAGKCGKVGGTA